MGKKRKKKERKAAALAAAQEQYEEDYHDMTGDVHVGPQTKQPWHRAVPWCWCRPSVKHEHPLTGHRVWQHKLQLH